MATEAEKKYTPTGKVTDLKLARKGNTFTATWKVPSTMVDKKRENRFDGLDIRWTIDFDGKKKDIIDVDATGSAKTTKNNQGYGEFKGNWGKWKGKKLSRKAFYPYTDKKLDGMGVKVLGWRKVGNVFYHGPWTKLVEYKFKNPRKPTVSISYDEDTMVCSYTVEADAGTDKRERHDTCYRVYAQRTGMKAKHIVDWKSSTSTNVTGSFDMDDAGVEFSSGKTVTVVVEAYTRGIAGRSDAVSARKSVAWPKKPAIKSVRAKGNGRVIVEVEVSSKTVRTAQLQRQANVNPGDAPSGSGWSAVEGSDSQNGTVSYMYDNVSDAESTRGLYTWYRVKVVNSGFISYSDSFRADALFKPAPSAENDEVGIASVTPLENGTSARVVIGFNEDDRNTGTEVAWSKDPNAWQSTSQPSRFQFDWFSSQPVSAYPPTADTAIDPSKAYYAYDPEAGAYVAVESPSVDDIAGYCEKKDYKESATVVISGLAESETCYISARRYLNGDDKTTYTPWANIADAQPAAQPSSVVLSGPDYVARGEAIELTWVFDGSATQERFDVHPVSAPLTCLAAGVDSLGYAMIDPEMYGDAESLELFVTVGTGGDPVDSNPITIGISDPPTCEVYAPATLKAQPASFEAYTNAPTSELSCKCMVGNESGIAQENPDGPVDYYEGDVLWADAAIPGWAATTWGATPLYSRLQQDVSDAQAELAEAQEALGGLSEGDEGYDDALTAVGNAQAALEGAQDALAGHPADGLVYRGVVKMPSELPFIDGCDYNVEASATDSSTGLASGDSGCSFGVAWRHQAPVPSEDIAVEVDEVNRTATIRLAAPEGALATDRYDLYRGTFDGYQLIRRDLMLDDTVLDRFAPFSDGERAYCVCTRTIDGDTDWLEFPYTLPAKVTRFDYPGGSAEVERGMAFSEKVEKRFEAREHQGGGTGGYYNNGVNRSGTYEATVFKEYDRAARSAVYDMASHPGSCFVRTPDGKAFQCNANLSADTTQRSMSESFSFELMRVDLTSEFMVAVSDITPASGGEGIG